jgi:hypothetical protein
MPVNINIGHEIKIFDVKSMNKNIGIAENYYLFLALPSLFSYIG